MTETAFSALPLTPAMLANLDSLGYHQMTPIQAESIGPILQGRDLIAQAKTGSGKTAAFGIGVLGHIEQRLFAAQVLVLCPTRELADQVSKEIRRLARATQNIKLVTLCGGMPFGPQVGSLEKGAHIIVGTPGRILKHLRKGILELDKVRSLVLDEADRMLDMGFFDDISEIIAATPKQRQTLLFSATYPDTIKQLSARFQHDPLDVRVESTHGDSHIEQHFYEVEPKQRIGALLRLLGHFQPESAVVFCNTKQECAEVAEALQKRWYSALALHGDLEQRERDQVLVRFANRSCSILVATDVAARGLDIKDLAAVINFQLSRDPEIHIHRIGRTGRAGGEGLALSLFAPAEAYKVTAIEDYQQAPVQIDALKDLRDSNPNERHLPPMVTLCIDGGRKDKIRPGDILGALTGEAGIAGKQVGKIDLFDRIAYVAIERDVAQQALERLAKGKIKGRNVKLRMLR